MVQDPPPSVPTGSATEDTLASNALAATDPRSEWQRIIDQELIEWGRDSGQLAEANLIPPSLPATDCAVKIALGFRDRGAAPPMRVVPDGDGGIVFDRWSDSLTESIEISRDGRAEYVRCDRGQVVARRTLPVG